MDVNHSHHTTLWWRLIAIKLITLTKFEARRKLIWQNVGPFAFCSMSLTSKQQIIPFPWDSTQLNLGPHRIQHCLRCVLADHQENQHKSHCSVKKKTWYYPIFKHRIINPWTKKFHFRWNANNHNELNNQHEWRGREYLEEEKKVAKNSNKSKVWHKSICAVQCAWALVSMFWCRLLGSDVWF